jgi:hypothetical protein
MFLHQVLVDHPGMFLHNYNFVSLIFKIFVATEINNTGLDFQTIQLSVLVPLLEILEQHLNIFQLKLIHIIIIMSLLKISNGVTRYVNFQTTSFCYQLNYTGTSRIIIRLSSHSLLAGKEEPRPLQLLMLLSLWVARMKQVFKARTQGEKKKKKKQKEEAQGI